MRKRFTAIFISMAIVMANVMPSFAYEKVLPTCERISTETVEKLNRIPFYVVNLEKTADREAVKCEVSARLGSLYDEDIAMKENDDTNELSEDSVAEIIEDTYTILEMTAPEKVDAFSKCLYYNTLVQAANAIERGESIKYIVFYQSVPAVATLSSNDPSDPVYWEERCDSFGSYSGYNFLYLESQMGLNALGPFELDKNVHGSIKWTNLAEMAIGGVAEYYATENMMVKTISVIWSTISDIIGIYEPAFTVSFGKVGAVTATVSGDRYVRTILIEDKLTENPMYAYREIGSVESLTLDLAVTVRYPVSERAQASGTYEMNSKTKDFAGVEHGTEHFFANRASRKYAYEKYVSTVGLNYKFYENMDATSLIMDLID